MKLKLFIVFIFLVSVTAFSAQTDTLFLPGENILKILKCLLNGENAEAYLSFDEKKLIFQSTRDTIECDQIFTMNIDGSDVQMVSPGKGRTTCAYFLPGDSLIYMHLLILMMITVPLLPTDQKVMSGNFMIALILSWLVLMEVIPGDLLIPKHMMLKLQYLQKEIK
jgi:hypothetical protein